MNKKLAILAITMCTSASVFASGLPIIEKKDVYKVGFAQTESNNPWRIAETKSFKDIAQQCNWELVLTDAAGSAAKQVSDVDSMIAQRVDVIFLPPREEKPLLPAVLRAKSQGIPVFLVDRSVDKNIAKPGRDYVSFLGSDFVHQGKLAAEWLINESRDKNEVKIIELEGSTGSSPANDRKKGFDTEIAKYENLKIVASQSGDFSRDKGRTVVETLLQSHPDVDAIYAHNDEMAIGAIQALEAAGKEPGKDVIVVSIDGTRDALQAIIDGKMGVSVESSPFFGPLACDVMQRYANGEKIEEWVRVADKVFTKENAEKYISEAY